MPKFICQVKTDPVLQAAREEIDLGSTALSEAMRFISRSIKDAERKANEVFNTQWAAIEDRLIEMELLSPTFKKDGFSLELSDSGDEVFLKSSEDRNNEHLLATMPRGLANIFKPVEKLQ